MDLESDADLIEACLADQAGAWERLCDRYADFVHAVARGAGLDGAEAGDVTQEVFLVFWRNLRRLRGSDRLRGWFATVSKRRAWRVVSRRSARTQRERSTAPGEVSSAAAPEAIVLEAERRHIVRRALRSLGAKCRGLLGALFFQPDRDYQQLSEELGMPVGSIGPTRKRCLEKLRLGLEDEGITASDVFEGPSAAF